jgi:hypothetical protein
MDHYINVWKQYGYEDALKQYKDGNLIDFDGLTPSCERTLHIKHFDDNITSKMRTKYREGWKEFAEKLIFHGELTYVVNPYIHVAMSKTPHETKDGKMYFKNMNIDLLLKLISNIYVKNIKYEITRL